MERVVSKRLFNFQLNGVVDNDILEQEKKILEMTGKSSLAELYVMPEGVKAHQLVRGMVTQMEPVYGHATYKEGYASCNHTTIEVPTKHDGNYNVTVLVHTPKQIQNEKSRPAIIYAHGGGCIAGSAEVYKNYLSTMACDCEVVVFNVDYRLAPETTCPNNVLDFYYTVKYVVENATNLGIDEKRIAIAGESGGGYVTAATMVKLAQNDESHLVKVAIPIIPMVSSYIFGPTQGMTQEEAASCSLMRETWKSIAGTEDIETKFDDPLLFPGDCGEDILAKMPPTIVWETEFDMFITEATRFASKLRRAGRLLDFVVMPGGKHGSDLDPSFKCFAVRKEAWIRAIEEYLTKA